MASQAESQPNKGLSWDKSLTYVLAILILVTHTRCCEIITDDTCKNIAIEKCPNSPSRLYYDYQSNKTTIAENVHDFLCVEDGQTFKDNSTELSLIGFYLNEDDYFLNSFQVEFNIDNAVSPDNVEVIFDHNGVENITTSTEALIQGGSG